MASKCLPSAYNIQSFATSAPLFGCTLSPLGLCEDSHPTRLSCHYLWSPPQGFSGPATPQQQIWQLTTWQCLMDPSTAQSCGDLRQSLPRPYGTAVRLVPRVRALKIYLSSISQTLRRTCMLPALSCLLQYRDKDPRDGGLLSW